MKETLVVFAVTGGFVLGAMFGGIFVHAAHNAATAFQKVRAEVLQIKAEVLSTVKKA